MAGPVAVIDPTLEALIAPVIAVRADERVWVTGDVHLAPDDPERAALFLEFFRQARAQADRLVILGDLFDYWVGPAHGLRCCYRPVIEAFRAAAAEGFPIDFICGNRDFLGPRDLESIGLRVHGDALILDRAGARTVVTHGDLLVEGDHSYKRYRRVVRSGPFRFGYWLVPVWFRLLVAWWLRRASQRKLVRVTAYAFPIDLARSQAWLERYEAQDLLMGHLHREETHEHGGGRATRMLPGWGARSGPHFVLGPAATLCSFRPEDSLAPPAQGEDEVGPGSQEARR